MPSGPAPCQGTCGSKGQTAGQGRVAFSFSKFSPQPKLCHAQRCSPSRIRRSAVERETHPATTILRSRESQPLRGCRPFCAHDFSRLLPSLSGPAADREIYSALVWRRTRRMDHLHAFLSGLPPGGLCLRASELPVVFEPRPGGRARHLAALGPGLLAHCSGRTLEACDGRCPGVAYFALIYGLPRPPLFHHGRHRAVVASVVQPVAL